MLHIIFYLWLAKLLKRNIYNDLMIQPYNHLMIILMKKNDKTSLMKLMKLMKPYDETTNGSLYEVTL